MPAVTGVWGSHVWGPNVWGANVWGTGTATAPIALFSVSGSGLTRAFDSTASTDDVGILSRTWSFGDGDVLGGNTAVPSHTYAAAGTYAVTLIVTNLGGVTTAFTSEVTVGSALAVTVVIEGSRDPGVVALCNMALAHCGVDKAIGALTDRSKEARACSLFYAQVRDEVLREFPWQFAQRREILGLVEEQPTATWGFSYRYPVAALTVHRIPSLYVRADSPSSAIPWNVGSDASGRLLYTDQSDAEIEYTASITDPAQFPPDFLQAVALRLGAMIAPAVMSDGGTTTRDNLLALYKFQISTARAISANEGRPDPPPESEFISARN